MTEVLGRFPTAESLIGNPLTMDCLRKHCLEVAIHELNCVVGERERPAAGIIQGILEGSIGGGGRDETDGVGSGGRSLGADLHLN
jgi:hypothetical protein